MPYVELHAHSAYSFLDGASQPEELAARAAELGYTALALTDHDGIYGSLEFAHAAKHFGIRPITGAELTLDTPGRGGGSHVTLLVESPQGYANLCRLITHAHARTRPKEGRDPLPPSLEPQRLEQAEGKRDDSERLEREADPTQRLAGGGAVAPGKHQYRHADREHRGPEPVPAGDCEGGSH